VTGPPRRMNAQGVVDVGKHNKPATRSCPGCNGTGTSTASREQCNVCRGTGRI
jgi:DnaJ-class molecular chaperone